MTIKRCNPGDLAAISRVWKDDSVFPWITDDMTEDKDTLDTKLMSALHNMSIYFLMPGPSTVIMCIPTNSIMWDIHIAVIKGNDRKHAGKDALECLLWMVARTGAKKFTTMVPTFNRVSGLFARRCGMKKEGTITKGYLKNGTLYDIDLFGVTAEEALARRK